MLYGYLSIKFRGGNHYLKLRYLYLHPPQALMYRLPHPVLACAIIIFSLLASTQVCAQYTKLRDFGKAEEGIRPFSKLATDGTFLYGTTSTGGDFDTGTIYKIQLNGTGFTVIHHFDNVNGAAPVGGLFYDGTSLYGTTVLGGTSSQGTIFKIDTDGSDFTKLFDFEFTATGGFPTGSLIADGSVLYGVTSQGGSSGVGTVFKINKDGTGHTKLVDFTPANGSQPTGDLVYDGTFLYGVTSSGGANFDGVIYKVRPNGTDFAKVMDFNGLGATGFSPSSSLYYDGTYLWGMTRSGGGGGSGTLFRILPSGAGYETRVDFNGSGNGGFPKGALISDGTSLYGTTAQGGSGGHGTVFKIDLDGNGFTTLFNQPGNTFGADPEGTLLLIGSTLYTTRSGGGFSGHGMIFKVDTDGDNDEQLYSFQVQGNNPVNTLVFDGTFIYGVTYLGGLYGGGTIYKIRKDGTGFLKVFDFEGEATGTRPRGSLYLDGTTLYGMTVEGGTNSVGVLYKIETNGTGYTKMLDFNGASNGSNPNGGLISDGTFLYGMTTHGGANFYGTIFKIMPNGTGYAKLRDLDYTNGAFPYGDLILQDGRLFGLASQGGDAGGGVLFSILPDGDDFDPFHEFTYDEGSNPYGSLYSDGTFLYGTVNNGGAHNAGGIFKINKNGSSFQTLHDFDLNVDGGLPKGTLAVDDTYLYGTTPTGGVDGKGTIFRIQPDGTGFDKLIDFYDGSTPAEGALLVDGINLYGTTEGGGTQGVGTLYSRSLADNVSITNFSPEVGAPGTYVTINGNDFDPVASNNTVRFNGVSAEIISASLNTIVAVVPEGATSGPITITGTGTDVSFYQFEVTAVSEIFNGTVKSCDIVFTESGGSDDFVQTFLPGVAGGKLRVEFESMDINDVLYIYDGPDDSAPLVGTLTSGDTDFEYTSTSAGGELTFYFSWQDDNSEWEAHIFCILDGEPIVIDAQPTDLTACENVTATFSVAASGATNITYQWQFSVDGGSIWDDIDNGGGYSNATTSSLAINTTGNFGAGHYRCRLNGDATLPVITDGAELTITPAPAPPTTVNSEQMCGPASVNLSASGVGQYVWYTEATGGTAITGATSATFATPLLTTPTTYHVAMSNGSCESTRTPVVAAVAPCDLVVYNAVSPNGDGKNDFMLLENIDIHSTRGNTVRIFSRWGDEVFSVTNYNNNDRVFNGINKNGNKLPSGIYFYKITVDSGDIDGYIELKY